MPTEPLVVVSQADREAAADAIKAYRGSKNSDWQGRVRRGEADDGAMVQAFARHALTARSRGIEEAQERMARGLERMADGARGANGCCDAILRRAANEIRALSPLPASEDVEGRDYEAEARVLLAAEIRADWIASYPANAVPSEAYALKEAANQPAALRALTKALAGGGRDG